MLVVYRRSLNEFSDTNWRVIVKCCQQVVVLGHVSSDVPEYEQNRSSAWANHTSGSKAQEGGSLTVKALSFAHPVEWARCPLAFEVIKSRWGLQCRTYTWRIMLYWRTHVMSKKLKTATSRQFTINRKDGTARCDIERQRGKINLATMPFLSLSSGGCVTRKFQPISWWESHLKRGNKQCILVWRPSGIVALWAV